MVDNITLNAGSGGVDLRTDDDGTAHWQYVKLAYGADNTQTIVDSTSSNPLPVALSDTDNAVLDSIDTAVSATGRDNFVSTVNTTTTPLGVSGTFAPTNGEDVSAYAAVTIHLYADVASATDGMTFEFSDENTFANPDTYTFTMSAGANRRFQFPVTAQFFRINFTNGGAGQTTFRVQTILHKANVLTSIHRLGDNMSTDRSAQVMKSVLFAQINGSGDFVPIDADPQGNLDVGVNSIGGTAVTTNTGNAGNGTQRVVLADDQPAVTVDGSGVTQPVSGTVTANLGATDNAVLDQIEVNTSYGDNVGNGTAAGSLRVTVANDSTGVLTVDNGGTFATQVDGAALTALQLIDNPIVAHGAAATGATGVSMQGLEGRSADPTAVDANDAVRALATLLGKQINQPYALPGETWTYAAASGGITNTTGVTAKAAAGAGVRNYISRVQVINGGTTATDVQIRDGAEGTVLWRGWAEENGGGVSAVFDPPLRGTADTLVEVACGTTGSATYFNLQGYEAAE